MFCVCNHLLHVSNDYLDVFQKVFLFPVVFFFFLLITANAVYVTLLTKC